MAPQTPAACLQSVAGVRGAAAANIVLGAHRTGTGAPRVSSANLLLVVAGIWTVSCFVLAVRVRIELRTVARRPVLRPRRKDRMTSFAAIRTRSDVFGKIDRRSLTHAEGVVLAASGYFHVTDLVYGFMAPRL